MTDDKPRGLSPESRDTAEQVFVVSAAMVGVCLTLLGIVGIITSLSNVQTLADEMLATDAMIFLIACMSAYLALRTHSERAMSYARAADYFFIAALVAIVGIGAVITLHLI